MEKEKNISFLDLLTMGLSIYVIIIFGIDEFVKLPLQISILLTYIDDCICDFQQFQKESMLIHVRKYQ